jgi:nucleosome assembly protein 1-like 1
VVKKTVPTESFFNFFDPPKPPTDEDDASSDIEERLELDYQLGEDIKEKLIPRAIDWFTGEALQYENIEDDFDEGEFEDEDDEDEDELSDDRDEDDESDEEVCALNGRFHRPNANECQGDGSKPKQDTAECKQS